MSIVREADKWEYLKGAAVIHEVYELAKVVLEDERFPIWSGSSRSHQHHYGKGGLLEHTFEVVRLCELNRENFLHGQDRPYDIDEVELFLAALFHDAGKMYDYEPYITDEFHKDCYKEWKILKR